MSVRVVEVPIDRVPRWVSNFARRHDGATLAGTRPAQAVPTQARAHDARPGGQVLALQVRGGDGEIAELHRWAAVVPGVDAGPASAPVDATSPQALSTIAHWCAPPEHLGLILIRRGGYAVGRAQGGELISHKSGTRYVQGRAAAGGWSQQRFARRRGNQADALVAAVADLAVVHLCPAPVGNAPRAVQGLVLGGDRDLAGQVLADPRLAQVASVPRRMLADLPDPRFAVLQQALPRGRSIPVRIIPAQ